MTTKELRSIIENGGLDKYATIYDNVSLQKDRFLSAIAHFEQMYGEREVMILSVPGRSEICGNHTDHNSGCVLAGAINRDVIAVAARNEDNTVRLYSEGYSEIRVPVEKCADRDNFERYTSASLIGGMVNGFNNNGYLTGGYDAYITSDVFAGSGISSSAAFEVMIGNILNHLYNDGKVRNEEIAKLAQYAENEYFGKPSGLMDQMACAVGGFVFIDFCDNKNPVVEPIDFSLKKYGYSLCIINTGGNHADLNDDYASVPREMKAVAKALGKNVLREVSYAELLSSIGELRTSCGDRAVLRAMHFIGENERVEAARGALKGDDINAFLSIIRASGDSSFKYLQNVYTNINVREQGLSMAICLTDRFLGKRGALRVHGGGFAGTIQVFLPSELLSEYVELIESVFGKDTVMTLDVNPLGACRLF